MVPEQGKRDPAGSIAAYEGVPTAALADRLDFDAARRLGGLPIGHGLGALTVPLGTQGYSTPPKRR